MDLSSNNLINNLNLESTPNNLIEHNSQKSPQPKLSDKEEERIRELSQSTSVISESSFPPNINRFQIDENPLYDDLPVKFTDVVMAYMRIRERLPETALKKSLLSEELGIDLYFKHEHSHHTGSFKERGGLNALLMLKEEEAEKGVIAASAGNHALALCYHAKELGIPVTVVMPKNAPLTKVSKCRSFGATVEIFGENFDVAFEHAKILGKEKGLVYVNGYNDQNIIAGAGTCGFEICMQLKKIDAVIVPVGGAGLIAGVALAVKTINPNIEVIGVEAMNVASFTKAVVEGKPTKSGVSFTLADGLAVPVVGDQAFAVAKKFVNRIVRVKERHIALAILRLLEREKVVSEGAGASGLAALLSGQLDDLKGKRVVTILCGGNIDITILNRVIDRGLAADGRLSQLSCTVVDRAGGLSQLISAIAAKNASVKDINHNRSFVDRDIMTIGVTVVIETLGKDHTNEVLEYLTEKGFNAKLRNFNYAQEDEDEIHPQTLYLKDWPKKKNNIQSSANNIF